MMDRDKLKKFGFLLGDWNLEYNIPESFLSKAGTDSGTGTFKKILNDEFVQFEYVTKSGSAAKGIFAWDDKTDMFRYYWFENSGSFQTATCNFINDRVLAMNWLDTLLVQTFTKLSPNTVVLKMKHLNDKNRYELVMEVVLTRRL